MPELTKNATEGRIAKNIARLLDEASQDAFVLNLGVGIPTQVARYITNENIFIQAENGMLGAGAIAVGAEIHPQLINAGRQPIKETPGCCYMDSSASFGLIRGGHVDATVLGAFEVDREGNVANWIIPNGKQLGVGGAMDLVAGANTVVIAMTHVNRGKAKLVKKCTLPVTGVQAVDIVVTELSVFYFQSGKVQLRKILPGLSVDRLRQITELDFTVAKSLQPMLL